MAEAALNMSLDDLIAQQRAKGKVSPHLAASARPHR